MKALPLQDNIIGFHHISIKANNFEETINFYKEFGFIPIHSWSLPEFNLEKTCMLFNPKINFYLEICDRNADMPTQGRKREEHDEYIENALLHICFYS
ncbi:MAG: hypothetical protein N4Q32_00860 [Neisseriaceae bacterium]|nr:hypothetical protein [Neisseriaceae bacterium]MCV2508974.1 hypothetical protein [Neisseriaceae bacterium]